MFDLNKVIEGTVNTDWKDLLLEDQETLAKINDKLTTEYVEKYQEEIPFYPPTHLIFNAFSHFNISDLKVCIIGMDPYHGPGQAMGLSFSVSPDVKIPPSLKNIFKEMSSDLETSVTRSNGDLSYLADQGVLLLNASLTVRHKKPGSHRKYWREYTDNLIKRICNVTEGVVFILWGNDAKNKQELIDTTKHHIITSAHPSPLSAYRGFFGCKHFSKCNALLLKQEKDEIVWL